MADCWDDNFETYLSDGLRARFPNQSERALVVTCSIEETLKQTKRSEQENFVAIFGNKSHPDVNIIVAVYPTDRKILIGLDGEQVPDQVTDLNRLILH